ncbi:lactate permease LctP family transporter [Sulfurospirillum halorespirans]|uniref:L-lactate permease n=1 Tax=Sulfurospirillum halorespirans DSM 13726 TaxID=1193502 RepID=A0A1D7TI38_9BACT|nr:lactate permease LctP family transporter [Sulfurospirillum halorespirans]AOO64643.1 L-lactate permease [Sulfurospirillum halorespirans DSM 13726]
MQTWQQVYSPIAGSLGLSALVALIPIIFFFLALAVFRMKGHYAATITLALSMIVAVVGFGMPTNMAFASAGYGFLYGLWPIAWIIVASVFLYKLTVKSGQFGIIRNSILTITDDQRIQVILIGFAFGAFLEGAAGFGAPVAITAAILVGLGFQPIYAAGLCLIANTAPVAFGALGIPILVAGKVTGIDPFLVGAMAGRQLPFLSVLIPLWIVAMMDGWRGVKEVWPAALVAGGSFALSQYATSNFIGPELPDVTSAILSIVSLTVFLKFWKPKNVMKGHVSAELEKETQKAHTGGEVLKAWSPFIILSVMVTIWTTNAFKAYFAKGAIMAGTIFNFEFTSISNTIFKMMPIVAKPTAFSVVYTFNPISATGTAIFFAAIISMFVLRVNVSTAIKTMGETLFELKWAILSIGMVLGFAFVMNYSGMSTTMALVLANTGFLFPFFSPILGWLGVFLTGSDTSSNALFCGLQQNTAQQLGLNETLMVTANTTGGVCGKMISPQSISIACASAGIVGKESDLFRFTVKHSLILVTIMGLMTMAQAYIFTWMIP